jgi:hypothetical protein
MKYLVDAQGFKQPDNDYVLKELAILALDGNEPPVVMLFEKPYSWNMLTDDYKKDNKWLQYRYHGLKWNKGKVPYNQIGYLLRDTLKDATKVYTIGSIQKKWLERFRFKFPIVDMEKKMCFPPMNKIKVTTVCEHHNGANVVRCAAHNVRLLKEFFRRTQFESVNCN